MNYNLHNGQGYSYHMLDCIVPASVNDQKSPFSLQNHCAETIVKHVPLNCQLLSNTPSHLHKVLWKAYLRQKYYIYVDNFYEYKPPLQYLLDSESDSGPDFGATILNEVPELLYHWPQAVFSLKELMPKLPPRLSQFTSSCAPESPFTVNRDCLLRFYKEVLTVIVNTFNKNYNVKSIELHKDNWKVGKIDVSGFQTFELATYFEESFEWFPIKCSILDSIGKLELVIDAGIDYRIHLGGTNDDSIEYDDDKDILIPQCASSTNSVIYKFVGVNVNHDLSEYEEEEGGLEDAALFSRSFVRSGAKSFLFMFKCLPTFPKVLENSFENIASIENITGISLWKRGIDFFENPNNDRINGVSTMKLVHRFNNLTHLNVRSICLHGRLDGLRNMHQGLVFLSLTQCKLKNMDIHQLIGSIHETTLQELNLSENEFEYDKFSNKLIELCKSLTNIQMLVLQGCSLQSWPTDKTALLFDSFKILPNIVYLDLSLNIFNSDQMLYIMGLHVNHSLRYLHISYPRHIWDRYENSFDNRNRSKGEKILKKYRSTINTTMNRTRSQFLYVEVGRFEEDFW